jgi:mono/diheme cytochrome c family protein
MLLILFVTSCSSLKPPQALALSQEAAEGKKLFNSYCSSCHGTNGDTVIVGPSLAGIATRGSQRIDGMDAGGYIKDSILEPRAYVVEGFPDNLMPPNFKDQLANEDIDSIVAYLLTLK